MSHALIGEKACRIVSAEDKLMVSTPLKWCQGVRSDPASHKFGTLGGVWYCRSRAVFALSGVLHRFSVIP